MGQTALDVYKQFLADIGAAAYYSKWRSQNTRAAALVDGFRDKVLAGTATPADAPDLGGNAFGRALVDAALMPLFTADPSIDPTPSPTPSASIYWSLRIKAALYVSCYGSTSSNDAPWSYADSGGPWDLAEAHAGKKVCAIQYGGSAGAWPPSPYYATNADHAWSRGAFTQYDFGTSWTGIQDILAMNANAKSYIGTLADQMIAAKRPVLFRPFWEMNGGWFVWGRDVGNTSGSPGLTATQYKTLWRNLWQIVADRVGGFAAGSGLGTSTGFIDFFWCPNMLGTGTQADLTDRYPGVRQSNGSVKYVDWIGWDGYYGNAHFGTAWQTPAQVWQPTHDVVAALDPTLPIGIGETAVGSALAAPGKAAFITQYLGPGGFVQSNPRIKYVNWFNDYSAETGSNQDLYFEQDRPISVGCPTANPSAPQTAFHDAISGPYYQAGGASTVYKSGGLSGIVVPA